MDGFADRVVLVTGGAGGIGLALGHAFAAQGSRVVLLDRDETALQSAAADFEAESTPLTVVADVTRGADVERARDVVSDHLGPVDILCNNAGVGGRLGPTWELTDQDWDDVIDVNLRGVVNGIRAFVPDMVARGVGHVVNTASMAGLLPMPWGSPYVATKHAVVGLTATLRWELQQAGRASTGPGRLSASVLCPGWTRTAIATGPDAGILDGHEDGAAGSMARALASNVASGMAPSEVAERVVRAVREDAFWILTHADQAAHVLPHYAAAAQSAGLP